MANRDHPWDCWPKQKDTRCLCRLEPAPPALVEQTESRQLPGRSVGRRQGSLNGRYQPVHGSRSLPILLFVRILQVQGSQAGTDQCDTGQRFGTAMARSQVELLHMVAAPQSGSFPVSFPAAAAGIPTCSGAERSLATLKRRRVESDVSNATCASESGCQRALMIRRPGLLDRTSG